MNTLLLFAWATLGAAVPLPALKEPAAVQVTLELAGSESALPAEIPGRILLERRDREREPALLLPARAIVEVELPAGSRWEASFEIPGWWGPRVELALGPSDPRQWVFNLRKAGWVAGQVRVVRGELPSTIDVVADVPGGLRPRSRCPLGPKGAYRCPLPAGSREFVLVAGAFAPLRFPHGPLAAGAVVELPTRELVPGSSLVAQVAFADGSAPGAEPPGLVRVLPATLGRLPSLDAPSPLLEQALPADGLLSLAGLPAGTVDLEVVKAGYSPLRVAGIELSAGVEIRLPAVLTLRQPRPVVFAVRPPADPMGLPWQVALQRRDGGAAENEKVTAGATDPEGLFAAGEQDAGLYFLRVADSAGNGFRVDWEFRLTGTEGGRVEIALDLIEVRGTVKRADLPVSGRLFFGGRRGMEIVIESDDEGRFEGTLPRTGSWVVDVESNEGTSRLKVNVEPVRPGQRARLEIELPATKVYGRVLDGEGKPVPGAEVFLGTLDGTTRLPTDDEGRFEHRGLPPGRVLVTARKPSAGGRDALASDPLAGELLPDQELGPLDLRLKVLTELAGRVFSSQGQPIPGAVVKLQELGLGPGNQVRTDADGVFTIRTHAETTGWNVTVLAPGAPLTAFQVKNDGRPLELHLGAEEGELTLRLPRSGRELAALNHTLRLFRHEAQLGLSQIAEWREGLGLTTDLEFTSGKIVVPRLAIGAYTACLGPKEHLWRVNSPVELTFDPRVVCRSGQLPSAGQLTLVLPLPGD